MFWKCLKYVWILKSKKQLVSKWSRTDFARGGLIWLQECLDQQRSAWDEKEILQYCAAKIKGPKGSLKFDGKLK